MTFSSSIRNIIPILSLPLASWQPCANSVYTGRLATLSVSWLECSWPITGLLKTDGLECFHYSQKYFQNFGLEPYTAFTISLYLLSHQHYQSKSEPFLVLFLNNGSIIIIIIMLDTCHSGQFNNNQIPEPTAGKKNNGR